MATLIKDSYVFGGLNSRLSMRTPALKHQIAL